MVPSVPALRIHTANDAPVRADGDYVLYWMIANRRSQWNYSLDRAVQWSEELKKPLLILEAVRCDYPWVSDRVHRFILQGMADNRHHLSGKSVRYYPYVETEAAAGKGLVEAFAAQASVVVTDDFPCFFLPRIVAAMARRSEVRVEAVDSNGILPLADAPRAFTTAYSFRRHMQKNVVAHLQEMPLERPLDAARGLVAASVPSQVKQRWPRLSAAALSGPHGPLVSALPIDHEVAATSLPGGQEAAMTRWETFVGSPLEGYIEDRNRPDIRGTSGMSAYLHFGHIGAHTMVRSILDRGGWSPESITTKPVGQRAGWWGLDAPSEAFLDQTITWRELGFTFCHQNPEDYDHFETLPPWALKTLADHAEDRREYVYSLDAFERGATHDPLWNAAQEQLRQEGTIHNYMRMLWGKKILEWSSTPNQALETMIELNNKYALDGRNPNSISGIFWTLGRFDRAWGPERSIFGKVRYMSSDNTARKLKTKPYLQRWSGQADLLRTAPR